MCLIWNSKESSFDSDPRLYPLCAENKGETNGGRATVSETVSKPASVLTIRHYCSALAETCQNSRSYYAGKTDWITENSEPVMKPRFIMFRRGSIYYSEDTVTRKQHSLRTRDESEALTLLHAKNESFRQPVLNRQIARTYLTATDPETAKRTWQVPMVEMTKTKIGATRHERHSL